MTQLLEWVDKRGRLMCSGRARHVLEETIEHPSGNIPGTVYVLPRLRFTHHMAPLILLKMYPLTGVLLSLPMMVDGKEMEGRAVPVFGSSTLALTGEPEFLANLVFYFPSIMEFGKLDLNFLDLQLAVSKLVGKHAPAAVDSLSEAT